MDLSFIICTYNGAARLPETLAHLASQANAGGYAWEVVVVDNASTDGTAKFVQDLAGRQGESAGAMRCSVIAEPTPGKTHAIKTGLRAATGRYFTLVDDDNHLCPEWVDAAVRFLDEHSNAGLIGGKISPTFELDAVIPPDFETRYKGYLALRDYGGENKPGVLPIGAGMTGRTPVMRALYQQLGSYLPDRVGGGLGSCEDLEKGITMQHLGWEVWYVPSLEMKHWIPNGRLTEGYIDRLWLEAGVAGAWLGVLRDLGPLDSASLRQRCLGHERMVRWEELLCRLPPMTRRLKRARFWRDYYDAKIKAVEAIGSRATDVQRMFDFIESAPESLRPPVRQRVTAGGTGTA